VSEFYYGIAEQRKLDLAARRIGKLINKTRENDHLKDTYKIKANEFKARVKDVQVMLADVVIDNTLAGARKRIEEFYEYKVNKKNEILRLQLELEAFFTNIQTRLTQMRRPPFVPAVSLSGVNDTVKELEKSEQERNLKLHDELNRQIRLHNLNDQHKARFEKIEHFGNEKKKYLEHKEDINSVAEATKHLQLLDGAHNAVNNVKANGVADLNKRTQYLLSESFEHGHDVSGRSDHINHLFNELEQLYNKKKPVLEDDLAREKEKERLRLKFAKEANDFKQWESDIISTVSLTHFGFTLKEVQSFDSVLHSEDNGYKAEGNKKRSEYTETANALKGYHVTDNVYTEHSLQDLEDAHANVEHHLDERRKRFDAELEVQKYNDNLCSKFAQQVDPLSDFVQKTKDSVATTNASLEDQEKLVESKLKSRDSDGASLSTIKKLAHEIDERKITHNEHTSLTLKDIEVQWEQYKSFLDNKIKQIKEEIELAKLRGLTPEDLKEIEDNFRTFDKNADNVLEFSELKACLYSLGEEKTKSQIEDLVKTYGDGKKN